MKVDDSTRFPHPVLWHETTDYVSGEFTIQVEVTEVPDKSEVSLEYRVTLTEPGLRELVTNGRAGVGLFVSCGESYFSELVQLGVDGGSYVFPRGVLIGRVSLRPMIWATSDLPQFAVHNCHPEFGGGFFHIPPGAVLGLDDEIIINVGREKLAQMDTIFALVETTEIPSGSFAVQLDGDRIKILAASDVYGTVNQLRGLKVGRPVVLNSVYLPAVIEVLESIKDGGSEYEGRRWHKVFMAKCEYLGINPGHAELWQDAQKLLLNPFLEIAAVKELLGE